MAIRNYKKRVLNFVVLTFLMMLFQNCYKAENKVVSSEPGSSVDQDNSNDNSNDQGPDDKNPDDQNSNQDLLALEEPDLTKCTFPTQLPQNSGPVSVGIDALVDGEIYVVYSGVDQNSLTIPLRADATASIFLFRGSPIKNSNLREVVVFGAGYGDPEGAVKEIQFNWGQNFEVVNSAAYDVSNVDYVIKNCFGMSKERTFIKFISPHGHVDHVNREFFEELRVLGYNYDNLDITVGKPDLFSTLDQNQDGFADWPEDLTKKVKTVGGDVLICNQEIARFSVASGEMKIVGNPEHTVGTINIHHIDFNYHFMGSSMVDCDFSGADYYFDAHKRAFWNSNPPVNRQQGGGGVNSKATSSHLDHDDGC